MASDPFDEVLNLEDQYYDQGYKLGYDDGFRAGKIEGRSVGLKKGYEKFMEAGRLQSKAIIWANRIPNMQQKQTQADKGDDDDAAAAEATTPQPSGGGGSSSSSSSQGPNSHEPSRHHNNMMSLLPLGNSNQRLEKNITSLYALVEPGTLSTENTDEAVNDFDDRFKRAQGKLKIVERGIGEEIERPNPDQSNQSTGPARNEI